MSATYLKCSLVISPLDPKYPFKTMRAVVMILKTTPKPTTTAYPTPLDSGGSPPKKESCPAYSLKGGVSIDAILPVSPVTCSNKRFGKNYEMRRRKKKDPVSYLCRE